MGNVNESTSFQPKPLDDDWCKWLVGEWEGLAESHAETAKLQLKVDYGLNGQFLMMNSESKLSKLSDEQRQYLKNDRRGQGQGSEHGTSCRRHTVFPDRFRTQS